MKTKTLSPMIVAALLFLSGGVLRAEKLHEKQRDPGGVAQNQFVSPAKANAKPSSPSEAPSTKPADLQPSPPAVSAVNRGEVAHTRWQVISTHLEELVKQYYPKAKFTKTNNTLHFEYNVKQEEGYYGDTLVPKANGILGDITLTDGVLPDSLSFAQELKNGIAGNTTFSFGSYSEKCKYYLVSHLVYPKISEEFKAKLLSVISSFKD